MNDKKTELESLHAIGAATSIVEVEIAGVPHIQVPPGSTLKNMEDLLDQPIRIKAHPEFNDVDGFAHYIEEFKEDGSRIFVDDSNFRFITVFDCHAKDKPAHGDHSATMKLNISSEWNRFLGYNEKKMNPKEFAEFLEDNIDYLSQTEDMTGADLMTMAQSFKINVKGDLEVEDTIQSGLKTLVIKDDSTVSGRNVNGQHVSFPEKIAFDLRIFKNNEPYAIKVFLRYRKSDKGLTFWIKVPDPDKLEEQAFDRVIDQVKDKTGLSTLKGTYSGYNHRR